MPSTCSSYLRVLKVQPLILRCLNIALQVQLEKHRFEKLGFNLSFALTLFVAFKFEWVYLIKKKKQEGRKNTHKHLEVFSPLQL